jgi:hypothetical protein
MSRQTAEIEISLANGQQAGKTINQLTAESVKLAREIKKLEIGSDEYVKKTEEFKQVSGRLKEVRTEAFATEKAQGLLNSTVGQFIPFNSQIQKFIGTYKGVSAGLKATTLAQRALNMAIAASGIGLLLIALGSLVNYLTSTQEGMDKVTRVTRPLFAIFERLKGLVQELGGSVFKGLALILKGDIREGLAVLGEGFKDAIGGVGDAIREGAAAGTELDKLQKQIEKTQNDMIVSQARLNRQIAEQSERARDASLSEKERQEAAQQAINLIAERTKAEDDLLALQIRKLEIEQSLNDTDRAGEAEMNRLIAQREELEASAARERVRLNGIVNRSAVEGEKTTTKVVKDETDKRIKEQERYAKMIVEADKKLEDLRISMMADETERKISQIEVSAQREIEAFEGTEEQKTAFLLLKEAEREQKIEELRTEQRAKASKLALEELEKQNQLEQDYVRELFFSNMISQEEMEDQLYDIKVEAIERRLALLAEAGETESGIYQKLYTDLAQLHSEHESRKTQITEQQEQARKALQEKGLMAASMTFAGFADLLAADEQNREKNWEKIKALKRAELLSNLPVEISNIWKNANTFPVPFNTIIGAAQTGLALGRFVQASGQLEKVSYAQGGPVFGPSHQAGGIKFSVGGQVNEMEGNEIILTKGVYQDPILRNIASDLNVMGGGRSFALGGPVVDRPMVNTTTSRNIIRESVPNQALDMGQTNMLLERIAKATEQTAVRPMPIQIQKIRDGLNTLNSVEQSARS